MTDLIEALHRLDATLRQTAPKIANRLQTGLSPVAIEAQTASFSWKLPQDACDLYRWHNGLSGRPGRLNLAEKLIRLKGKWHGELSGRENEIHVQIDSSHTASLEERCVTAKFLPLEYALAGHRHLKLGRCSIDLLPLALLKNGNSTLYCMMRLDSEQPIVYCANGTKLPPISVTEAFLSTQPQFDRLSNLVTFLTGVLQPRQQQSFAKATESAGGIDCAIDLRGQ